MAIEMTIVGICGELFAAGSALKCTRPSGHEGSHTFTADNTPDHTYYIERDNGLYLCCLKYLQDFIQKAVQGKWPRFQDSFRTRCTECTGWIRLRGETFVYEMSEQEKVAAATKAAKSS